jgi:hypothetical protein
MPSLTVAEKSFWKDRIAVRLTKHIEAIKAGDPSRFDRITRRARELALESLGLAGPHAELEAVRAEEAALARRKKAAQRALVAAVRGVPTEEVGGDFHVPYGCDSGVPAEVARAIEQRQEAHAEALLAEDPLGRRVAELRAEKERLLDIVWLATSPAELRKLWSSVGALLGEEPSGLERAALAIEPPAAG